MVGLRRIDVEGKKFQTQMVAFKHFQLQPLAHHIHRFPMPTVSRTSPVRYAQAYDGKVFDWGKRLWSAVWNNGKYSEAHEDSLKEFDELLVRDSLSP